MRMTYGLFRLVGAAVLLATGASAPARSNAALLPPGIDNLITIVRSTERLDRPTVERTLGIRLRPASRTNAFRTFTAGATPMDSLFVATEWREPIPGSGATAGPVLVLSITGGCHRRAGLGRYGPLTVTDAPHHGFPNEETYWSHTEAWGTLSFGFAERSPDCLSTIVLSELRPPGP